MRESEKFSSSDFARMEQGAKKTENDMSKIPTIMQQTKSLELIHPFFFPIQQQILPAKEHKIHKQLVMFRNNKRNSRLFLTLKVGQTFI